MGSMLLVLLLAFNLTLHDCLYVVPDLPLTQYVKDGDVNIGGLFPVSGRSPDKPCGSSLRSLSAVQVVEAMVYAIELINNDTTLLPDINLGYAILDDCSKPTSSQAQATRFVAINSTDICSNVSDAGASGYVSRFDVVGVVGSLMSSLSKQSASFLGIFQVPQISYSSTSDELSDKSMYPYFMRVVPPDKFQVRAIVDLIEQFGWSYISVVYADSSYGQTAVKNLRKLTATKGICIAVDEQVPERDPSDLFYDKVIKKLIADSNAKVVVLISGPAEAREIFKAIRRANVIGRFIFIGSDGWGARISSLDKQERQAAEMSFTFQVREVPMPDYESYFQSMNPSKKRDNPWFGRYWDKYFGCTVSSGHGSGLCNDTSGISYKSGYANTPLASMVFDAVFAFAHSIQHLVRDHCPNSKGSAARSCITGPLLLKYLKQTTFAGRLGTVAFDQNGDMEGQYVVNQLRQEGGQMVQKYYAVWDAHLDAFTNVQGDDVMWADSVYINSSITANNGVPESVCSKPCAPGEFVIPQERPCCWLCKLCRDNEIVSEDNRTCVECPKFFWPDTNNFTTCLAIPPVYLQITDPLGILLLVLSIVGFAGTVAVFVFFVKHNNTRLIKATSRELAHMMLAGVGLGYLLVLVMIAVPSRAVCYVRYFGYTVSFTLIYAPLLTRTNRIWRIFENSKRNARPILVSPRAQVVIACILILVQIVISAVTTIIIPPVPELAMEVNTIRYVELECPFTLPALVPFLAYNIILVIACSVYAFKTRKLPHNFNESRFISMCVYTTVVIWMAFIPTYFTTSTTYYKVLLLSLALIVNDTIILMFLYLPKIYALQFLDEDDMKLVGTSNHASTIYPTTLNTPCFLDTLPSTSKSNLAVFNTSLGSTRSKTSKETEASIHRTALAPVAAP